MKAINIAAIDIGSNGARLLVKRFDDEASEFERIRKLMFIRVPLRLGNDVFTLGKISKQRAKTMLHMMKGFKQATKAWGKELPEICQKTIDAANQMFEDYYKSKEE